MSSTSSSEGGFLRWETSKESAEQDMRLAEESDGKFRVVETLHEGDEFANERLGWTRRVAAGHVVVEIHGDLGSYWIAAVGFIPGKTSPKRKTNE